MLCGGSTLLPGFTDRLKKDMKTSYKTFINKNPKSDLNASINILALPRRAVSVFTGGAMFANILTNMKDMWITKKDYEEHGYQIVIKRACNSL
jgi:actin-related protein